MSLLKHFKYVAFGMSSEPGPASLRARARPILDTQTLMARFVFISILAFAAAVETSCFVLGSVKLQHKPAMFSLNPLAKRITHRAAACNSKCSLSEPKNALLSFALASSLLFPNIISSVPVHAAAPAEINEAENFKVLKVSESVFWVTCWSKIVKTRFPKLKISLK